MKKYDKFIEALKCNVNTHPTTTIDNTVIVSKLTHTPKDFYCLSVDKGAFVVKYNDKVSVTGNCHSVAGAWVFRKHLEEEQRSPEEVKELHNRIIEAANTIYEHESRIVDMIFEQGDIEGIDSAKLKMFVKSRINICLSNLGISPIFEIVDNQIETWFYDSINKFTFNDFFSGIGREYTRDWEESNFTWKKKAE